MKEIVVVGAAIVDDGKILAAQRSMDMDLPLKWEFPGGKVETGETHQQALKREISEELGVDIEVGELIGNSVYECENKRICLHVYSSGIIGGEPIAREHAKLKWIDIDAIGEVEWAEPDIPVCKELLKKHGSVWWNSKIDE